MDDLRTVVYPKERYACLIGIGTKRVDDERKLREPERVAEAMTKWFARRLRGQPHIAGRAHVEAVQDFLTERWGLHAWAYAFQDVKPEHRETLAQWIDDSQHHAIELLER